jgi:hypothetical protein
MLLERPTITAMSFEDIMSLPETLQLLNSLPTRLHNEFKLIAEKYYDDLTDPEVPLAQQDRSVQEADKTEKMFKKKIVPRRFKDKCHSEFSRSEINSVNKTTLSSFYTGLRNRSNNDLWNCLYGIRLDCSKTIIITVDTVLSTTTFELVSNVESTIRCPIRLTNKRHEVNTDLAFFCYPKSWSYSVKQALGCRGDGTTSITGIVNKITNYVAYLAKEKAEKEKETKEREIVLDNIEKVLGTREINFGYRTPNLDYTFQFSVTGNDNVKYSHLPDGRITLNYIDPVILCKLDPVLAMTLFR